MHACMRSWGACMHAVVGGKCVHAVAWQMRRVHVCMHACSGGCVAQACSGVCLVRVCSGGLGANMQTVACKLYIMHGTPGCIHTEHARAMQGEQVPLPDYEACGARATAKLLAVCECSSQVSSPLVRRRLKEATVN